MLENGECGKVGPYGNPGALAYTKRNIPASTSTPWLGPDGGSRAGPGDPGFPGTGGSFGELCIEKCTRASPSFLDQTSHTVFPGPPRPAHAPPRAVIGGHACGTLIGACNPMT